MKTTEFNANFINNYIGLITNLSPNLKLELIGKITKMLKRDISKDKALITKSFGAWQSKKSADEIIDDIRESRNFSRKIDSL